MQFFMVDIMEHRFSFSALIIANFIVKYIVSQVPFHLHKYCVDEPQLLIKLTAIKLNIYSNGDGYEKKEMKKKFINAIKLIDQI